MSFSGDINNFVSKAKLSLEKMQKEQEEKIHAFLQEKLGEEYKDITSIKFDNDALKFYDVVATESVIKKLREGDFLRE